MAGATELEAATSCVTGRRSNQLNYAPRLGQIIHLIIVLSDAVWLLQVSSNSLLFHLVVQ